MLNSPKKTHKNVPQVKIPPKHSWFCGVFIIHYTEVKPDHYEAPFLVHLEFFSLDMLIF